MSHADHPLNPRRPDEPLIGAHLVEPGEDALAQAEEEINARQRLEAATPLERALAAALERRPGITQDQAALVARCVHIYETIHSHAWDRIDFVRTLTRQPASYLQAIEEFCADLDHDKVFDAFVKQVATESRSS